MRLRFSLSAVVGLLAGLLVLVAEAGPYPSTPTISKVTVAKVSSTSATVTFTVAPGALGYVVFERINPAVGPTQTVQTGIGTSHSATATGLVPGAHYKATAHARFNWLASLVAAPPVFFTTAP